MLTASLERVPETGRLRFMDVSEAQEREASRVRYFREPADFVARGPDATADAERVQ